MGVRTQDWVEGEVTGRLLSTPLDALELECSFRDVSHRGFCTLLCSFGQGGNQRGGITLGETAHFSGGTPQWGLGSQHSWRLGDECRRLEGSTWVAFQSGPRSPLLSASEATAWGRRLTGGMTAGRLSPANAGPSCWPSLCRRKYILYLKMNSPYHPVLCAVSWLSCFPLQVLDNSQGWFLLLFMHLLFVAQNSVP